MSMRIPAMLLLVTASCGGTRSSTAASSSDPRLDLALAAPRDAFVIHVPGADVRRGRCIPWHEVDASPCDHVRVEGDRRIVPFSMAAVDPPYAGIDHGFVFLRDAAPLDGPDLETAVAHLDGPPEIVAPRRLAGGGYAAILERHDMGGVAVSSWARVRVGRHDLVCFHGAHDRAEANAQLDVCASLRAP